MTKSSFFVRLSRSENTFINYPALGLLEVLEFGTTGSVISAVFRCMSEGKLHAPVEVRNPEFEYTPDIAQRGHDLVADLRRRQIESSPSRDMRHELYEKDTDNLLAVFASRSQCETFCELQGIRIEGYFSDSSKDYVKVVAHPNLATGMVGTIYSRYIGFSTETDAALTLLIQALGIRENVARRQVQIFRNYTA